MFFKTKLYNVYHFSLSLWPKNSYMFVTARRSRPIAFIISSVILFKSTIKKFTV